MPILDLLAIQGGTQSAWATGVTPTVKLMGVESLMVDPGVKAEVFHDQRASLAPGHLAALTEVMPSAKMDVLCTYDDIGYYLDNQLGQATPSGAGPYTRGYGAPTGAVPTRRILGLSYGDATDYYRLIGALISKATFKGENGKPLRASYELIGNSISNTALAAVSDRAVTLAMGDHCAISIDAWGGTMGATAIATSAFAFELMIDAKLKSDQFLGALVAGNYHDADGAQGWDGELKLSLELNSATRAQLAALISQTTLYQRQVRLRYSSGTSQITFDFAGTSITAPELWQNRNGVVTFDATLKGTYNTTLGNWLVAQNINSVATLA